MENIELPNGYFWCRKGIYQVQIELGCYELREGKVLLKGFEEGKFIVDGVEKKYAVKKGFNKLEQNQWITSPSKPFIITGTVGERWIVKVSNLSSYDVNIEDISIEPIVVSTIDPSEQEFLVAHQIPAREKNIVIPSWAFSSDGNIDELQIMQVNSIFSEVSHLDGDFIVSKFIPNQPEYWELPEKVRNTREAAELYDPRVVNGSIMVTTYDVARTKEEIDKKYSNNFAKKKVK